MEFPTNQYQVIYADPPWAYRDRHKGQGGAEDHYRTLSTADLVELPVAQIARPNCLLFLWATFPNLPEAMRIMTAWGFKYKTQAFTWIKTYRKGNPVIGLGSYTRSNAEVCLLGLRGKKWDLARNVSSVVISCRGEHSTKPPEVRDRIVQLCGDVPRIELFARDRIAGWDAWGDEIERRING